MSGRHPHSLPLTDGQLEVLQRMADGQTQLEIAQDLRLSRMAVTSRLSQARLKLNANTLHHAIARGYQEKILFPPTFRKPAAAPLKASWSNPLEGHKVVLRSTLGGLLCECGKLIPGETKKKREEAHRVHKGEIVAEREAS
jgi:DNA-binding CsgD family transcriptional regulator